MKAQQRLITPQLVVQVLFFIILVPLLPLLISRHWSWWEAWVYALVSIVSFVVSRVLVAQRNPDLIAERAHTIQHADAKPWDKRLVPLLGLAGILMMIVAGLDELLDWSPAFSLPLKITALLVILAGNALTSYALVENRFFSGMVRLQTDRGHQVVSAGPYRWVRHPGYAGAILIYLALPFFLDSSWLFLLTLITTVVLVLRTSLEDGFLQDELEGYREYARRVRYRLLPGVW